jgi:serine kinase of HPr protein (carbohydrate metabolism regulator)
MENVHATCLAVDGKGVLLRGPAGSGKSDLTLRLIDEGAVLISDDLVAIEASADKNQLHASYPETARKDLVGLIEVRGIGFMRVPHRDWVRIMLVIDLSDEVDRLPEPKTETIQGVAIEALALNPFEVSTTAKIRMVLNRERVAV